MVKWTQAQINRYQDTLDLEDGKVKKEERITPTHTSICISIVPQCDRNYRKKEEPTEEINQPINIICTFM